MNEKEMIEFAKWLVHSRRKMVHKEYGAKWFASDLMSELCHIEPFNAEHPLIKEYKKYKAEQTSN